MKINREDFLGRLKKSLPGIETGNYVFEGADTFSFDNGYIHSYNDNISVSIPLLEEEKELSGAIKADELYKIISKLPGKEFDLVIENNIWKLTSDNINVNLSMKENEIKKFVSEIDIESKEKSVISKDFIEALKCCKLNCNNTNLAGIYVKDKNMIAIDTNRLNMFNLDLEMGNFWVSDNSVAELIKIEGLEKYSISDRWVHFFSGDGVCFSCRKLITDNFPYEKIVGLSEKYNQEKDDISGKLPKKLKDAMDRASTLSMDIDSHEAVKIHISPECIECYSERSTGKYQEKILWEEKMEFFDPVDLYLDYSIISYGLNRSSKFYIKQIKDIGLKRIVFYDDKFKSMAATYKEK